MEYMNYEEVLKGICLIWNNRFDEADELFKTRKDVNPRYAVHYAEIAFLRSFITADSEDTQIALTRLNLAKELAETHISAFERGHLPGNETRNLQGSELITRLLDARIAYGDTLYMLAILQMTRDAKIKGAFNLRKSWKQFEKCLKQAKGMNNLDPELTRCLEFGAGFFLFAISIIPQKFLKLVELVGFKADRDAGLHYIRTVHSSNGIRSPFATMILLFNNLLLPRGLADAQQYVLEADKLIKEVIQRFPNGSLFYVMGSHCSRKQCNIDDGIKMMEMALENSKNLRQPPLVYRYELANCFCMKLEWKRAIELYLPLIQEAKFQVRVLCALQLAASYIMIGEHEKAIDLFSRIPNLSNKKSGFDQMVARQAKRYMENGGNFAAFEVLYLRRDLVKMIPIIPSVLQSLDEVARTLLCTERKQTPQEPKKSRFASATASGMRKLGSFKALTPLLKKSQQELDYSWDNRASYLLLKGSMLKTLGKHEEAIVGFKEVIEMQDHLIEKLYVPYCLYELGECFYIRNQLKDAEDCFGKCGKWSSFAWEDPLKVRLRVTFDQLKKGNMPSKEVISIENLSTALSDDRDMESLDEVESLDEEELEKKLHIDENDGE